MTGLQSIGGARRLALPALLLAVAGYAWVQVFRSGTMEMMPAMEAAPAAGISSFVWQWGVMMTAMMLPSAYPMIMLYAGASRRAGASNARAIPAELFAFTYVALWLLTGVPVFAASVAVDTLAARVPAFAASLPYAIAAVIFGAGIYQFTALKRACLRRCRTPMDFIVREWRSGYSGSLRLAAIHAAFCIGCCWALMVLLVVAGAMSLPWVLAIALAVIAEKLLPNGERTARIIGCVLIFAALAVAVRPELAGALKPHSMRWHR